MPLNTPNVSLINFGVSVIGADPRPGTGAFTIDIKQTMPTAGTSSFTGELAGNFAVGSTTATLTFTSQSVMIGGVTYTLNSKVFNFPLEKSSYSNPLFADISDVAPEPGFLALTGIGFGCLAFVAFRRRREN